MRLSSISLPLAAATLVLAMAGCSESPAPEPPAPEPPKTLRGSFDLSYTIQTSPNSTAGTGSNPQKINAIHFFDQYIVVEYARSGGRVFPIEQLREFRWQ